MSAINRTGQWAIVAGFIGNVRAKSTAALENALKREALRAERLMKEGIQKQAPGGKVFTALSAWTKIKRKAQGGRGTKALIRHGDFRRSIKTVTTSEGSFVGVLRTARGREGQPLVNVAAVHEFGKTMVLNVDKPGRTKKTVRSYFMALFAKKLIKKPLKRTTKFLVIKIPARPFINPVFKQMQKGQGNRITRDVAATLGLGVA